MKTEERYVVEKLSRSYNKIGIAYACYTEDPDEIELRCFVRDKHDECQECSLTIRSNVYGNYGGYKESLMSSNRRGNENVWTYYPVDNRFNDFIVELNNEELSGETKCRSFSTRYLMSTSVPLEKPIEFGFPDSDKGWQIIFDCDYSDNQKEYLIDATGAFELGASANIVLPNECSVEYSTCSIKDLSSSTEINPNGRMYRTPLLYGDFNKNGQLEFVNMFIQSGGIVFTEIYEKDSVTIKPIPCTLEMKRELMALPIIQNILLMSSTLKLTDLGRESGIRFIDANEEIVATEEAAYYDGDYYGIEAVEPPPYAEEEGFYSVYGGGRSLTYIESGVEVKAEFPGGEKALKKYIKKNLNYPFRKKRKEDIVVKVTLKITTEGKVEITYASATSTPYQEYFIQEAKRLCSEMPNWTPAEHNGKKVNMEKILYIEF